MLSRTCRSVFSSPRDLECCIVRNTEFTQNETSEAYPPGVEDHYWHVARSRILLQLLKQVGGVRVLDVGCSRGILVNYLLHCGIESYGVDLALTEIPDHLRDRIFLGLKAEDLPLALRNSIDTILLCDVIEHLPDPDAFLASLCRAFPNLSALVITVPARKELWSNYDEHFGHYRRYDLGELLRTVETAGFKPVRISYLFRLLYLPARALLRFRGKRDTKFAAPRSRLLHRLIALAILLEWACLPAKVFGSSCVCAALKPRDVAT